MSWPGFGRPSARGWISAAIAATSSFTCRQAPASGSMQRRFPAASPAHSAARCGRDVGRERVCRWKRDRPVSRSRHRLSAEMCGLVNWTDPAAEKSSEQDSAGLMARTFSITACEAASFCAQSGLVSVGDDAIASGPLGAVKGAVGLFDQRFRAVDLAFACRRRAKAYGQEGRDVAVWMFYPQLGDGFLDSLGHSHDRVPVRIGQQDYEFLAAVSGHEIVFAHDARFQRARNLVQTVISGLMTRAVVVLLEAVDVEHDHADRGPMLHG